MGGGRRKAVLIATGLGTLGVIVAVVVIIIDANAGSAGCLGMSRDGWVMPLVAVSALGGLTWVLLREESHRVDDTTGEARLRACPSCGRDVLERWRLCPYCGAMLDGKTDTDAPDTTT